MVHNTTWAVAGALCALGLGMACALSMRVQPGGALVQGLPVGRKCELPVPLTIFNDDVRETTVRVTAMRPSDVGAGPPRGYSEIPDPAWMVFSPQTLTIPPLTQGRVRMFVTLPDDPALRNQHWSVSLAVRGAPGGRQQIGLAVYPRFEIETRAASSTEPPAGPLAVSPSLVTIEKMQPGAAARKATLRLWNNTPKPARCRLSLHGRPEPDEKPIVALSHGWSWLPDTTWLRAEPRSVEVPPDGWAEVTLTAAVPEGANYGGAWEGVVFAETEGGLEAFARLRITTNSR